MNKTDNHMGGAAIGKRLLEELLDAARLAGGMECLGCLAGRSERIVAAVLLPSDAGFAHAEAAPVAIARCYQIVRGMGLRPIGLWHSHGDFDVFHSSTDIDTIGRVLPAMALESLQPDPGSAPLEVPIVISQDQAALPIPDQGKWLEYTLIGPEMADTGFSQRQTWTYVRTAFLDTPARAMALRQPGTGLLMLRLGGVSISLGIPGGAVLRESIKERCSSRSARLYSVVVNARRRVFAETYIVRQANGRLILGEPQPCRLEVDPATPENEGRLIRL